MYYYVLFFFFSSRRRHTRFDCDWSSDVCSSDLQHLFYALAKARRGEYPDTHARATGIEALELEAFRRLRNKLTRQPLTMPRTRFCCDRCTGSQCHTPSCPTLSH